MLLNKTFSNLSSRNNNCIKIQYLEGWKKEQKIAQLGTRSLPTVRKFKKSINEAKY